MTRILYKRAFAVLLILLITMISCSETAKDGTVASADITSEAVTEPEKQRLPDADYGGEDFVILTNARVDDYKSKEFAAEEIDGSSVNDAVFQRNAAIEERYNVNLAAVSLNDEAAVLRKSVTANEAAYDIALIRLFEAGSLALNRMLADFNELPHLDFDAEWWDHNACEQLSLGGRLYMTLGDLNINDKDMTWCLFFSKKLSTDYNLPDIYDIVNGGKWTFDRFAELCKNVSTDVNGDGKYNDEDTWGHVTVFARSTIAYMFSMGAEYIVKDSATDLPALNFGDERIYDSYSRIITLFTGDNNCKDVERMPFEGYAHQWRKCEAMFGESQILFYGEAMQNAERFRSFDNDLGILPLPSDKEGDLGANMVWMESFSTVIPLTTFSSEEKAERCGLLLEAIQSESHETVLPAYYDKCLKTKFSRDESSSDMIDIIFGNRFYDIATYYGWGGVSNAIMSAGASGKEEIKSVLTSLESKAQADIDAVNSLINETQQ